MSNATGAFSSILMSLPLIAVPCLAVFGLPSIGPASAEAETEEAVLELGDGVNLGAASSTLGTSQSSASFSPIVDAGSSGSVSKSKPFQSASSDQPAFATTSGHRDASAANTAIGLPDGTHSGGGDAPPARYGELDIASEAAVSGTPPQDHMHSSGPHDHGDLKRTASDNAPAETIRDDHTWETSLAQLGELGIRDFHLTNSDIPGRFYFSCNLPNTGRNVTRRFEAEADTPVAAAEEVLKQIQASRSAQ